MNTGTKIRTLLRIATSVNTVAYAAATAIDALNNSKLSAIWAALTVVSDIIVGALTTYCNQDYTEAATVGTGYTRILKSQKNGVVNGENFFDFVEEPEGGEENA